MIAFISSIFMIPSPTFKNTQVLGREFFFKDRKTQDAVVRNLEIIGEAVKHLSASLTTSHPAIPWKQIAGMRDKLIHEYFGVDLNLV
jgi:uncharacterized protein with HEPN domain